MKKQILINVEAGEIRIASIIAKKLEDFFVERIDYKTIVGNIYKAQVSSIVPAIGAAFVDYGEKKNGFLYVKDALESTADFGEDEIIFESQNKKLKTDLKIENFLKKGQEVLVQVVKEELGTKGARLTTNISLPGRFLVYMPNLSKIGVSRKIKDDKERLRIREMLKTFKLPEGVGLIARTAAINSSKRDLARDLKFLDRIWRKIATEAKRKTAPSLIWQELDLISKTMRDFISEEVDRIIVDDKTTYKKIKHMLGNYSIGLKSKLEFYKGYQHIYEAYGIEKEIDKIFHRKVYLKCGGYITIEPTEGMVAIDVNSGSFTKKKNQEETIRRVNIESAVEIARQLRLRDLGGIIVIDFIDMPNRKIRKEVFDILYAELKKDKAKANVVSISELDLVEMTRQRTHKSMESVSYRTCPYCNGRGLIMSAQTVIIMAIRKLKDFLSKNKTRKDVELILHPDIADIARKDENKSFYKLQRLFGRKIVILDNSRLHLEDIDIKST